MAIPTREEMYEALVLRQGRERTDRFASSVVAVCGLGGLGSHIAYSLARAGVGHLVLIDFDRVDVTNLHRQQYKVSQVGMMKAQALVDNLREIAPYTDYRPYGVKISPDNAKDLLGGADVICEAFDRAEEKAVLTDCVLEEMPETYLVAGSGMAGMGDANLIKTRQVTKRFFVCGDGVSDVAAAGSLVAPRVMACAAHQALKVLQILAGEV